MEIRLKIIEMVIVVIGLISSGVTFGIAITNNLRTDMFVYAVSLLIVSLSIIIRKRFKNNLNA